MRYVPTRTQPLTIHMFLCPLLRSEHFNNTNLSLCFSSKRKGISFFLKSSPSPS